MTNAPRPKPAPRSVGRAAIISASADNNARREATEQSYNALSRMASFAKLTADWQTYQQSYLDNFTNFVLGAMAAKDLQVATPEEISAAVQATYGLRFPPAVVHQIARRASKRKQLQSAGNGRYVPSEDAIVRARLDASAFQQLEREQQKLATGFVEWAHDHGSELDPAAAATAIMSYVETYYGTLMSETVGKGSVRRPDINPSDETRMIAGYVEEISRTEPDTFAYVLNIAKGSMLVASLFTRVAPQQARPFLDTYVIFDTRILLRALGYEGSAAKSATREYMTLAASQGAHLGYFDFTLRETESILASAQVSAEHGKLWSWQPGSVGAYFFGENMNAADIALAIGRARSELGSLGLDIVESPSYGDGRHVVSEKDVEEAIKGLSLYQNEQALVHDVKAITAIVRMRRGRASSTLEECRAVFVTANSIILRASRRVEDLRVEPFFVSILDTDLASLLWIKTPLEAPELPKGSLIATCLSVLRPSQMMWGKYVREFEHRLQCGELTDAELLLVRQRTEQQRVDLSIRQIVSDEQVAAIVDLTLKEARDEVRRELDAPNREREKSLLGEVTNYKQRADSYEQQAETYRDEAGNLQAHLQAVSLELSQARGRLQRNAARRAHGIALALSGLLWVLAIGGLVYGVLVGDGAPPFIKVAVLVLAAVFAATGGAGFFIGPARKKVENWILQRELRREGLLPQQPATDAGPA